MKFQLNAILSTVYMSVSHSRKPLKKSTLVTPGCVPSFAAGC